MTVATHASWLRGRWIASLALAAACAACAPFEIITMESNHITYRHAFSDAPTAAARGSAERVCGQRKQVAVRIGGTCSLTDCYTHYQCMDQAAAEQYR